MSSLIVFLFIIGVGVFLFLLSKLLFLMAKPIPEEELKRRREVLEEIRREEEEAAKSNYHSSVSEFRWSDKPVSLPAITEAQRQLVRENATNWRKNYDSLQGAVVDVVGAFYVRNAGKELYRVLQPGTSVSLRPDPYNSFDSTAVKVFARNAWIGYVPSAVSEQVYAYCCLSKFEKCYVVKSADGGSLKGLQIVMLIKPSSTENADAD